MRGTKHWLHDYVLPGGRLSSLWLLCLLITSRLQLCETTTTPPSSSSCTYSLSYETVVGEHVLRTTGTNDRRASEAEIGISDPAEPKIEATNVESLGGYAMFTNLATEIASDVIQLYAETKDGATTTTKNRTLEMDLRCYETLMGGARCNMDHFRPGEVTIQIAIAYDVIENATPDKQNLASVNLEVSIIAPTARNVLIKSIPKINKQLNSYQGMVWSIRKRHGGGIDQRQQQLSNNALSQSLETVILERSELDSRMRIASSEGIELWQYTEGTVNVRSLFIHGYLYSTTHLCSSGHAEALVHPAVLSIGENPEHIVIVALEPTAILKEVLKHTRVRSVLLLGVNLEALELAKKYMPSNNDCTFMGRSVTECMSQPNVHIVNEPLEQWLTTQAAAEDFVLDVVLIDVPAENNEWLSLEIQTKLRAALSDDSMVVISSGSVPKLADSYELDARHSLLHHASRPERAGGLEYFHVYVYDEPLASPMASSFIAMFVDDSHILTKFIRTNAPAIEIDIVNNFHHSTNGPLTLVYDGATHVDYQRPSRAWQHWHCHTPPGNHMYECTNFLRDWYDRDMHYYHTEVRKHAIKGRSLTAVKPIPKGVFVLPDDATAMLRLDHDQWNALNDFIARFPDADLYRQVRDFFVAYGFQSEVMGQTGWAVSVANNSTFTNHACTEHEANVKYVDDLYISEDDDDIRFSPFQVRNAELAAVLTRTTRDIEAGEELQMDYASFRSYPGSDSFHVGLLNNICNSGSGMVAPDEGDLLIGYGDGDALPKADNAP